MKIFFALLLSVSAPILAWTTVAHFADSAPPASQRTPVIVELFTSEGCSSCPPADALLAKLEQDQPVPDAEVIALEEHVDYWNQSGWVDPFSSAELTSRQYVYGRKLKNGNAYTPQAIVNGSAELVGSNEPVLLDTIRRGAAEPKLMVSLTAGAATAHSKVFTVSVGKLAEAAPGDSAEVWLAIAEAGLHSDVTRGENAGKDLHHASIVRTLRKIGVASGGGETSYAAEQTVQLDKKWNPENLRVIAFVQEKKSRRILGGAATRIRP